MPASPTRVAHQHIAPGANLKMADQLWEDLELQGELDPVVERVKQDIKRDIYGLEQRLQRIDRAWARGDVKALMYEGVFTKSDKAHIDAAWEAQQAGDEAAMYKHLEDIGMDLVRFAGLKRASDDSVMEKVLPIHEVYKLVQAMEKEKDEESADLVSRVYSHLSAKLRLSDNESRALNRLLGSVQSVGSWDAAMQRNNIFKAADLLGMKLPSYFFASEHKGAGVAEEGAKQRLAAAVQHVDEARMGLQAVVDWARARVRTTGSTREFMLLEKLVPLADRVEEIGLGIRPLQRFFR